MSKLFSIIGLKPKWGNGLSSIKSFLASPHFKERLAEIRRKKMSNPQENVSREIENLLEDKK